MTTRERIIRTLGSFAVTFSEEIVDTLEKRVQKSTLKEVKGKPFNPLGFAFVVARNWAISEQRRIAVEARRQAEAMLATERERMEKELFERCRLEFDNIFFKLLPDLKCSQPMQIRLVQMICFGGLSDEECVKALPNTTHEQRQKWKVRGMKLVSRRASSELTDFLKRFLNRNAECCGS